MSQNATCPPRVIGCEVGKDEIVVADSAAETILRLANTPEGLAAFVRRLGDNCLVVCEATGGHKTALLLAALDANVPVHRADARKLKAFIRSHGRIAKPSTPRPSSATARNVTPSCPVGSPPVKSATPCVPSPACVPSSSSSAPH